MGKKAILFFILSCCKILLISQNSSQKIVGVVYKTASNNNKEIFKAGEAIVFIPGVSSTTTDDKGYYSLDISQCQECKAGISVKIYVNSKIGYAEKEYVIPSNSALKPFNIEIQENGKLILNGAVRDKDTGKFLKGIKVNGLIQNGPTLPTVITDENGIFQMIIRMDGVTSMQAIQLFFLDENVKYQDTEKVVFINQYEPIKIYLQRSEAETLIKLITEEILINLQNINNRLDLIYRTLYLNNRDDVRVKMDSLNLKIAPKFYKENKVGYNELIIRSTISSLRQALNAIPLRQEFGRSLAENFVKSNIQEPEWIQKYLNEFGEVQWAEQILFESLENLASSKDTCSAQLARLNLSWETLLNRANFYNIYALQLLNSLKLPQNSTINERLQYLGFLSPNHVIDYKEFEKLLLENVYQMELIVNRKIDVLKASQKCLDAALNKYSSVDSSLTIFPSDTWEQVLIKALSLRALGRSDEAINAFTLYEKMFSDTDSTAERYSKAAIVFTKQLEKLNLEKGVFITHVEENSNADKARVKMGDIVIAINQETIDGSAGLQEKLLKIMPDRPLFLTILRLDKNLQSFEKLQFEIPKKPLGIRFITI